MTQNEHVYAICCRPEVHGDVISCKNVKTIERYVVVNFEVANSSSFSRYDQFATAAEAAAAEMNIDDSIKRKRCVRPLTLYPGIWENGINTKMGLFTRYEDGM